MELFELHAIAKGKVQGIGFRHTVCEYANQLGLAGTVKNLADKSVEIYAQGSKEDLMTFIDLVKRKIGGINVEGLSEEYTPVTHHFENFSIIRSHT
jgi:acylphosphatase